MFSYYGSKSKIVHLYPKPKHDKIIEPFAGSARYALRYWEKDVLLVDKYQVIVDVWHYLQQASEKDILGLPVLNYNELISDYTQLSEIEKSFLGFNIKNGMPTPVNKPSERKTIHRPKQQRFHLTQIAKNLHKIRHWKIIQGDYRDIENKEATYFIDPPYKYGGEHYKESNKNINYPELSEWCKSRLGQIIVCENTKANWMDFKPLSKMRGSIHETTEAIWYNGEEKRFFDYEQQKLF